MNVAIEKSRTGVTAGKVAEEFLEDLADALQIPDSLYEEAEKRYHAVGAWLSRQESVLSGCLPEVYPQGSFALGTVIRPTTEEDEYDVDMVCQVQVDVRQTPQKQLKHAVLSEMTSYARRYSMQIPENLRRCVRLQYANQAKFHLDITPAIPDGGYYASVLQSRQLHSDWADSAVFITDKKHPNYHLTSHEWPHSNPQGYLRWFKAQMQHVFEMRRRAIALREGRFNVTDIPDYRIRTPLQSAIQILKRHRDMNYDGDPEHKPISIIITTLAAHAYQQETTIGSALFAILASMERFIEQRNGETWIGNPVDPLENFADKWAETPEKETSFYRWLESAKEDFTAIASESSRTAIAESIAPVLGPEVVERAINSRTKGSRLWKLFFPSHKKAPPWANISTGKVRISSAKYLRDGFRWKQFNNGKTSLPKGCELMFEASTNVMRPFDVFWQVVNTGAEATRANNLRGGFEQGKIELGGLKKKENTRYRGAHTVECFIVKDGLCVAQSGPFIVNIR